jgi:RNA polymerase sigma-70 factor (ECF subfamily)
LVLTDQETAIALQSGDTVVFEDIFKNYYERLCAYANTMLNDLSESEELVQSTFVSVWEKRQDIDIHTSVKAYLYRAIHNSCLNRLKHRHVQMEYQNDYRYSFNEAQDNATQELISKELEQQINLAIEQLPPQCQTVFRMSRFDNLTYAEIASQLNVSVKTIENHMVKALKILRGELKDYLPTMLWVLWFNMN